MKAVSDLLREADPLDDDARHLDEARERIRRTVVAAASVAQSPPARSAPPRRIVLATAAALVAALTVISLVVGPGERGIVQAAVRFEVRLAEVQPVPGLTVARVAGSPHLIYLHPEIIVMNEDVAHSWVIQDGPDRFGVSVELLDAGAQRLRQATAAHVGRPIAILIDGEVVTTPTVRSPVSSSAVISGDYTRGQAERIVNGIGGR